MASPAQPLRHPSVNGQAQFTNGQPNFSNGQPQLQQHQLQQLVQRIHVLRTEGHTPQTNPELERLIKIAASIPNFNAAFIANGHAVPNGAPQVNGTSHPQPSSSPVLFTSEQEHALKAQVQAFKFISRGVAIPEALQQALRRPTQAIQNIENTLQGTNADARLVDSTVKIQKNAEAGVKEEQEDLKAIFTDEVSDTAIYPYNAYIHPFTHLRRAADADPVLFATRLQRLIVPTMMPSGLDPHQILAERERFINARVQRRIHELESLPSTLADDEGASAPAHLGALVSGGSGAHGKLRALIELKSLRVLDKQREMRALVAERLTHGSLLPLHRSDFRRTRKPALRDARMTEQMERKQRVERERKAKQKHVEQLNVICVHARDVLAANRAAQDRMLKLGRAVQAFHSHTEKEEQKRIERISKERLKALKADDEEAYMKLIDTAKDTRITHLLRQTDGYLDSLAQAVVAQQNADGAFFGGDAADDEPTNEATFGAQVDPDDEPKDKKRVDYYTVAHRIKEKITQQPGILVGGTLKDYQIKGLQWMVSLFNNKLNGILADEMGLGKTIQTISLITFLIEAKRLRGPYLVIVPLSTMTNWSGEFAKWAPSVKMIAYKGNPNQRRALQGDIRMNQFQVLLTTYEYIIKDRPVLSKTKWLHMIIDEGHRMKNTQSKLTQTLTQYYHTRHRLILTGTPLQNNLPELWALLNFVLPKIFNSVKSFDEWFNTPFANSGSGDKIELNEEEALLIIRRLHKVLRPFLLRRLKKDVESELPDKVEKVIKIKMSGLQSQLYRQMKKFKMIADGSEKQGKSGGVKGLSNELMQLRKICQHPFLFESVEDKINPDGMINDKIIRSAGKIELLARILPKFFATDHRILIFFQMTKVMDIMEDFLKMMNYKYLRLDGGTKTEDRAGHVQLFNAPNSEYKVFILSTRAGGLGLNLQTADTVIIYDSDWNPHADLQAQDRAHRIGQTKVVRILRFITEKSVEEAMYARARYKLDIDDKVIQAGRFDNKSTQEEQEEFLRSILEADQDEENEEAGDMNDEEINEIISRSEKESEIFRDMDIQREREAAEAWRAAGNRGKPPPGLMTVEELPDCYRTDAPFDIKDEDEGPEGRGARKRNIVSYNDGLSDEQWAIAIEEGEDIEELAQRTRHSRVTANGYEEEDTPQPEPASSRGRKGKKGKAKVADFDIPLSGKRKRVAAVKAMSVTPSIQDEEEDDRNSKRRKTELTPALRDKMKKAFLAIHKAVTDCEDDTGRKRSLLFKEIPDRHDYPDYYSIIAKPIAMNNIRKRVTSNNYKDVNAFRDDFRLMFNNARTYNQEGSWVYVDAEEMEKVFNSAWERHITGSGLPGAVGSAQQVPTPGAMGMIDDERPVPPRSRGSARRQVVSDDEYLTPSDEE